MRQKHGSTTPDDCSQRVAIRRMLLKRPVTRQKHGSATRQETDSVEQKTKKHKCVGTPMDVWIWGYGTLHQKGTLR